MLKISINGKKFRAPATWEDVTLEQCAWLSEKIGEQPEEIVEYYKSFASDDGVKLPNDMKALEAFVAESIGYLLDLPNELRLQTRRGDIKTLGSAILPKFVLGALGYVDYQVEGVKSFKHRRSTYLLPESGIDIGGQFTPLSKMTAIEACYLSDIVMARNIAFAPLAIAIACRKKGEPYNEDVAQRRAADFKSLPASIYWELQALVTAAHDYLRECYKASYGKGKKSGQGASTPMWSNTLVEMAVGKPSELEVLHKMNFYDFVHLLNERNKTKQEEWKMKAALSGCKLK
ncbi:MAG: hypothetical protein R3Y68_09035 [Rikenellaceae bacterium]